MAEGRKWRGDEHGVAEGRKRRDESGVGKREKVEKEDNDFRFREDNLAL